jgi:hypothetical protein
VVVVPWAPTLPLPPHAAPTIPAPTAAAIIDALTAARTRFLTAHAPSLNAAGAYIR